MKKAPKPLFDTTASWTICASNLRPLNESEKDYTRHVRLPKTLGRL